MYWFTCVCTFGKYIEQKRERERKRERKKNTECQFVMAKEKSVRGRENEMTSKVKIG